MVRDPMNTPVHAVRHTWAAISAYHKAQAHRTAGGVRDPEKKSGRVVLYSVILPQSV